MIEIKHGQSVGQKVHTYQGMILKVVEMQKKGGERERWRDVRAMREAWEESEGGRGLGCKQCNYSD